MQIVHQAFNQSNFKLTESFLAPYRQKRDSFKTLLSRSSYLTKYCRNKESWTDTIRRVVEGNASLVRNVSRSEAEALFHLFWTGQCLPPGRSLWVGGVPGIPAEAFFNCWGVSLRSVDDWCWTANQLMLGGGVGVGISDIASLPAVSANPSRFAVWCKEEHANYDEVKPESKAFLNGSTPVFCVPDSREGWVEALRITLTAAFEGRDQIVDVSEVRRRGLPIRTFGGIACGPGPLTNLLRAAWAIVRSAAGRRLSSIDCLDITNHIGLCIRSGNVRRSAILILGDVNDSDFRNAKKDASDVTKSHRHTSNNTIAFRSHDAIRKFDWNGLVEDVSEFGEPGIANMPLVWKTDPEAEIVNPCVTGDTRVATQFGLVAIQDLVQMGQDLNVTADCRVEPEYSIGSNLGSTVREATPAFKTGDSVPVFRVTTNRGYTIKATEYHKFPTPHGFIELRNLDVGDTLLLQSAEGQWGNQGDDGIGTIIGYIEGDGNLSSSTDEAFLRFWGSQMFLADKILPACQKLASTELAESGRDYAFGVVSVPTRDSCEISSVLLGRALAKLGYNKKGHVPEVVWQGTRACVRGYIRGLFATDGQINWSKDKQSFSVRLSQSNPGLLREVQMLLLNFGVVSSVYPRRDAGFRRLPNGKGTLSDYWCLPQFDLVISKQNAVRFSESIGFILDTHSNTYAEWKSDWKRNPYKETYADTIVSIEPLDPEPVYCLTQASHHTFIADGIVTGNCGEQFLHNRESCNLVEVFPANFEPLTDPVLAFELVTRYALRQRMVPLLDPQSQAVGQKNMRLGVSLGGICDFNWTPEQLNYWYRAVRQAANDYADELHVAHPKTVTTVKPSGTISLLNESSPGIHAPFAPYYIRRARLPKNDPMLEALIDAGVTCEDDVWDSNTSIFSFPTKARHTRITVQSQTLREQLERQAVVQEYWADNAVSSTISYNEDETGSLAKHLEEFVPRLKSTSVLPNKHGYKQPPYEEISEDTYTKMLASIKQDHPLSFGAAMLDAGGECEGGSCPLR